MTWKYELTPASGRFTDETLNAAREYWSMQPIFTRASDGLIVRMETVEARDWAVASGHNEGVPPISSILIDLRPESIELETQGLEIDAELYSFAVWLKDRAAFEITSFGSPMTLERFRRNTVRDRKDWLS